MSLDKLVINNQTFTHDKIHAIPQYLKNRVANKQARVKTRDSCTKETDYYHLFYGNGSDFSNFRKASFSVDGQDYYHNEQFLSFHKALMFDAHDVADQVMMKTEPEQQRSSRQQRSQQRSPL